MESSGLVRSRRFEGVYWTHNDGEDTGRVFAVDERGRLIAEVAVEGATQIDWEDIAVDDDGFLYVADIGNNENARRDLSVYRLREPDPGRAPKQRIQVERRIRFRYPDQRAFPEPGRMNFDAEALFAAGRRLYILSKHRSDTRTTLYRFPAMSPGVEHVLERVGEFDVGGADKKYGGMVTAADLSADGRHLAVLTYHAIFVFARPEGSDDFLSKMVKKIDLDQDVAAQCEALAWRGTSLLFTNEQGWIHSVDDPFDERAQLYPAP